ncbi:ribonuclease HI family protein [Candidatus Dependentiae bacterium]
MSHTWKIFVDGAARGNPGKAGAGIYITNKNQSPIESGIYLGTKTNNQAEYLSLLFALFTIKKELKKQKINFGNITTLTNIKIFSDSELLVKQMNGEYRVKNPILFKMKTLVDQLLENVSYKISHVLREKNKVADKLANIGIDKRQEIPIGFKKILSKSKIKI